MSASTAIKRDRTHSALPRAPRSARLTGIVAVADYDAWRDALLTISELAIPPAVDLVIVSNHTAWARIISDPLDDQFQPEYAKAVDVTRPCGMALHGLETFRVMLRAYALTGSLADQVASVRTIANTIPRASRPGGSATLSRQ